MHGRAPACYSRRMTDLIMSMRRDLETRNFPVISEAAMREHVRNRIVFRPPPLQPPREGFYEGTCEEKSEP